MELKIVKFVTRDQLRSDLKWRQRNTAGNGVRSSVLCWFVLLRLSLELLVKRMEFGGIAACGSCWTCKITKKKNVKGKGERVCTSCWSQQCCIILEPAGKMENVAGFWLILVIASCCWLLEKGGSGRRSLFAGGWDKEMDVLWFWRSEKENGKGVLSIVVGWIYCFVDGKEERNGWCLFALTVELAGWVWGGWSEKGGEEGRRW